MKKLFTTHQCAVVMIVFAQLITASGQGQGSNSVKGNELSQKKTTVFDKASPDNQEAASGEMWHRYDAALPGTHIISTSKGRTVDAALEVNGVAHLFSSRVSLTPHNVFSSGVIPKANVGSAFTHVNAARGWYGYGQESGAFGVKFGFTTYGKGLDTGIGETMHLYGTGDVEGRYRYLYYDRLGGGNGDDEGTAGSSDQMLETSKIPVHTVAAVDDNQHLSLNNAIVGTGGGAGHIAVLTLSSGGKAEDFGSGDIQAVSHLGQLQTIVTTVRHGVSSSWGTASSRSISGPTSSYTIATPPNLDYATQQDLLLTKSGGTLAPAVGFICLASPDRFERARISGVQPAGSTTFAATVSLRNAMGFGHRNVYWFQGPGCDAPKGGGVIAKVNALTNGDAVGDTSQVLRIAGFPDENTAVYVINGKNEFRSIYSIANNILPDTIPVLLSRDSNVVSMEASTPSDWCERSGIRISGADDPSFNGTFTVTCKRPGYTWSQVGKNQTGIKATAISDRHRQRILFYPAAEVIGVTDPTNKQRVYANFVELENNDIPWAIGQTVEIDKTGFMPARKTFDVLDCYSASCSGYQGIFSGSGVRGATDINGVGFYAFNYGNANKQYIYEGFGGPYKLPSYMSIGGPWKTYFDLANTYAHGGDRLATGATLFNLPCPTHSDGTHDCSYANDNIVLFRMCTAYWNCISRPPMTYGLNIVNNALELRSGDRRVISSLGNNYQLGSDNSSSGVLNGSVTVSKTMSIKGDLTVTGPSGQVNISRGDVLATGKIDSSLYVGPEKRPSGNCDAVGWSFSQDGHITFCDGKNWIPKI